MLFCQLLAWQPDISAQISIAVTKLGHFALFDPVLPGGKKLIQSTVFKLIFSSQCQYFDQIVPIVQWNGDGLVCSHASYAWLGLWGLNDDECRSLRVRINGF